VERITLQVSNRQLEGKRVRHLRARGVLPANLFGHGIQSKSLQVDTEAFRAVFAKAGTNTLVALLIDGATDPIPSLIRGVQRDVISNQLLHADFYAVSMKEKIRLSVPLAFVGVAPGVETMGGILLHNLEAVEIECLPGDLVHSISVDISGLTEIGSALYVKDLNVGDAVTIHADPEELVVKVVPPEKEEEEVAPAEAPAAPSEVEVVAKKKEKEEEEAG
jgi:large subunit ribosomal protein L25